jgi:hypothetical protein
LSEPWNDHCKNSSSKSLATLTPLYSVLAQNIQPQIQFRMMGIAHITHN